VLLAGAEDVSAGLLQAARVSASREAIRRAELFIAVSFVVDVAFITVGACRADSNATEARYSTNFTEKCHSIILNCLIYASRPDFGLPPELGTR
jgi:hypothetical protein